MSMKKTFLITILVLFTVAPSCRGSLSLPAAREISTNRPSLTAQRYSIAANQKTEQQAFGGYLPQLSASHSSLFDKELSINESAHTLSLRGSQLIFDASGPQLQTKIAELTTQQTTYAYQASSSEMFGNSVDDDKYQRLTTPMIPVSPYGCAKLLAFNLVRHYRAAYNLNLCNGVLFNHESPYRGSNFVTSKVIKTAVQIKKGFKDKLILGNLDSYRDWGHAKDYVRAIKMIVDYPEPKDWIVSTGKNKSVRDMCEYVFRKLELDYKKYVIQDKKFVRNEELKFLRGDSSETQNILGWKPEITFENMMDEMIDYWLKKI